MSELWILALLDLTFLPKAALELWGHKNTEKAEETIYAYGVASCCLFLSLALSFLLDYFG